MNQNQILYIGAGLAGGLAIGHFLIRKGHTYTAIAAIAGGAIGYYLYNHSMSASTASTTVTSGQ